jgi:hypothetical protein
MAATVANLPQTTPDLLVLQSPNGLLLLTGGAFRLLGTTRLLLPPTIRVYCRATVVSPAGTLLPVPLRERSTQDSGSPPSSTASSSYRIIIGHASSIQDSQSSSDEVESMYCPVRPYLITHSAFGVPKQVERRYHIRVAPINREERQLAGRSWQHSLPFRDPGILRAKDNHLLRPRWEA